MNTLTEFLLARIAEDGAGAEAWQTAINADDIARVGVPAWIIMAGGLKDPSRILAECEAKWRIVELAIEEIGKADAKVPDGYERAFNGGSAWFAHNAMVRLALPYVDHPDFNEEWRV